MEIISGVISTILIIAALVALPLGLRARRRALKEIATQSSDLDKRTSVLEQRVKSFAEAMEPLKLEEVAKPLEEVREPAPTPLREILVPAERAYATYMEALSAEGIKTRFAVPKVFPKEAFVSFAEEFSHIIGEREFFKIAKTDIPYGKVKIISKGRETGWHSPTSSRYLPIEEERVYVK